MFAALLPLITTILDKVLPDQGAADAAKLEVLRLAQSGELAQLNAQTSLALAQLDVNKTEAANPSLFVSGWRPFIGWTCGAGLCYEFLFRPVGGWLFVNLMAWQMPPDLPTETLLTLLGGLLGLGTLRTVEKVKGAA